jgi:EAL domain-containing protein (putative c-di-GMP-specific phosphodiesterase class I)
LVHGDTRYEGPEQLLRDADSSLDRAKRAGRNRIEVYGRGAPCETPPPEAGAEELARAIDRGEIVVWFQPVLSLKNLRILGFEALARWQHPERGIVGPGEFIPLAERTGLILALGESVLQQSLAQLRRWGEQRLPITWLAVNLSAEQFQHADLIPDLERIFRETGANPQRLALEITEGTAARDPERAVDVLRTLRDMGIRLALDDFGTGYSSMSYLKRFPIHTLKIDREFVRDLPESQEDAAIATTVITMCRALGLKVVAEGVENERQALFLRSIGCDEVQGFMYSKPIPAAEATELLRTGYQPN